jgi:peptide/nickel transport system substrate-binding protein
MTVGGARRATDQAEDKGGRAMLRKAGKVERARTATRREFLTLAAGAGATTLLAPYAGAFPVAAASRLGGVLTVGGESVGDNYDPGVSFQGWAHTWVLMNIFDRLVESYNGKTLVPGLAESWTISDDGRLYTFKLRRGVKFHDGTPFNADAVVFNYMRMIDDKHPFYNKLAVFRSNLFLGVKEWRATGDYEVQMVREYRSAAQLALMSHYAAGFMSPASIKKAPDDYGRRPVGTGPFTLVEAVKGNRAVMEANPNYWRPGQPKVGRVVINVVADSATMTAGLLSGEIDATPFVDFQELPRFRGNPNLTVALVPALNLGYLGINSLKPPLDKPDVRRALNHAVNRRKIVDVVFGGQADVAGGYFPKASWAYAPEFANYYPYDPAKAKQYLAAAGLPNGFDADIWVQTNDFWPRIAELIQADLGAVGIKAGINKIDAARFFSAVTEGKHYTFVSDTTPGTVDPEEMAASFFQSSSPRAKGRFGYGNKEFDDLLQREAVAPNQTARKTAIVALQRKLLQDMPTVNLYYGRFAAVANQKVVGYTPIPLRIAYFNTVAKRG